MKIVYIVSDTSSLYQILKNSDNCSWELHDKIVGHIVSCGCNRFDLMLEVYHLIRNLLRIRKRSMEHFNRAAFTTEEVTAMKFKP